MKQDNSTANNSGSGLRYGMFINFNDSVGNFLLLLIF